MIAVLQRVSSAEVHINQKIYSTINTGLLVLLGISKKDTSEDIDYIIKKIMGLRIFNDSNHKMNLSVVDINGEILVVSQFTLLANTKRGKRPSFIGSANIEQANKLYNLFINRMKEYNNLNINTGKFGAMMDIKIINNGPATFILNSE